MLNSDLNSLLPKPFSWFQENNAVPPPVIFTIATGGTVIIDGNDKIHIFNANDNFNILQVGTDNTLRRLIIAGGAPGVTGGGASNGFEDTINLTVPEVVPIVVGDGGILGAVAGNPSSYGTDIAQAPGSGGDVLQDGQPGGGGAGANNTGTNVGGAGIPGQNFKGGDSPATAPFFPAAGGGSPTQAGDDNNQPPAALNQGNGAPGILSTILGFLQYFAGAGGGGIYNAAAFTYGLGGIGGGGDGGNTIQPGVDGVDGLGGGGGGGSASQSGGRGGKGVVIVRYKFQ